MACPSRKNANGVHNAANREFGRKRSLPVPHRYASLMPAMHANGTDRPDRGGFARGRHVGRRCRSSSGSRLPKTSQAAERLDRVEHRRDRGGESCWIDAGEVRLAAQSFALAIASAGTAATQLRAFTFPAITSRNTPRLAEAGVSCTANHRAARRRIVTESDDAASANVPLRGGRDPDHRRLATGFGDGGACAGRGDAPNLSAGQTVLAVGLARPAGGADETGAIRRGGGTSRAGSLADSRFAMTSAVQVLSTGCQVLPILPLGGDRAETLLKRSFSETGRSMEHC